MLSLRIFKSVSRSEAAGVPAGSREPAYSLAGTPKRVLLGAILLLGLAVGAVGWTVMQLRNDAVQGAVAESGNIASILSGQLARSLDSIDTIILQIKKSVENLDLTKSQSLSSVINTESFRESINRYLTRLPWIFNIAIADQDGHVLVTTAGWPTPAINVADRDYFLDARLHEDDKLNVSVPIQNRVNGQRTIVLSRRIEGADRAFLGIVYVGVNTDYFESIYASVQSINSLLFTLVRKDGIILFRYPSSTGDAGRKLSAEAAWLNALSSGQTGFRILAQNDGQVRFVSSRAVAQYPLFVNTSVTEISALAVWRTRATAIGIGSAVLLLCSTGLLIAVGRQVRRLRSSEARLAYLAHYDSLTDLAGRALFSINLDAAVAQMARTGDRFAIFMIDLEDFKAVNDTCGHGAGDALLRTVGGRLQSAVGGAGLVARLGGDEFAVLAPLSKNESQCADLARRILQETVRPCDLGEMEFVVGLSIGIAIAPRDGTDAVALMKNADAALYASKSSGRNRFSFFSPPAHAEPHDGDDLAPSLQPAQQENPSAAEVA